MFKVVREINRILKPQGQFILIDVCAPSRSLCDTFLQSMEILRDPSHIRDYSLMECTQFFGNVNLAVNQINFYNIRLEFNAWVTRMKTPQVFIEAIKSLQQTASEEVKDYFQFGDDGSFTADVIYIQGGKR